MSAPRRIALAFVAAACLGMTFLLSMPDARAQTATETPFWQWVTAPTPVPVSVGDTWSVYIPLNGCGLAAIGLNPDSSYNGLIFTPRGVRIFVLHSDAGGFVGRLAMHGGDTTTRVHEIIFGYGWDHYVTQPANQDFVMRGYVDTSHQNEVGAFAFTVSGLDDAKYGSAALSDYTDYRINYGFSTDGNSLQGLNYQSGYLYYVYYSGSGTPLDGNYCSDGTNTPAVTDTPAVTNTAVYTDVPSVTPEFTSTAWLICLPDAITATTLPTQPSHWQMTDQAQSTYTPVFQMTAYQQTLEALANDVAAGTSIPPTQTPYMLRCNTPVPRQMTPIAMVTAGACLSYVGNTPSPDNPMGCDEQCYTFFPGISISSDQVPSFVASLGFTGFTSPPMEACVRTLDYNVQFFGVDFTSAILSVITTSCIVFMVFSFRREI